MNTTHTLRVPQRDLRVFPDIDPSIQHIDCRYNLLRELSNLPPNLRSLACDHNLLRSLDTLPDSLTFLSCRENEIDTFHRLPASLEICICAQNGLETFPSSFPPKLRILTCNKNALQSLPSLPDSLEELQCDDNQLSELPALPISLKRLDCASNELTALPELHEGLVHLYCENNSLTTLPFLPESLQTIDIYRNPIEDILWQLYSIYIMESLEIRNFVLAVNRYLTEKASPNPQNGEIHQIYAMCAPGPFFDTNQFKLSVDYGLSEQARRNNMRKNGRTMRSLLATSKYGLPALPNNAQVHIGRMLSGMPASPSVKKLQHQLKTEVHTYGPRRKTRTRTRTRTRTHTRNRNRS